MKVDTKAAREFAEGGDRYTGPEVRLWVHNLCDEVDRLREALQHAKNSLVAFKFMPHPTIGHPWEHHDEANLEAVNEALGGGA